MKSAIDRWCAIILNTFFIQIQDSVDLNLLHPFYSLFQSFCHNHKTDQYFLQSKKRLIGVPFIYVPLFADGAHLFSISKFECKCNRWLSSRRATIILISIIISSFPQRIALPSINYHIPWHIHQFIHFFFCKWKGKIPFHYFLNLVRGRMPHALFHFFGQNILTYCIVFS